MVLLTCKPFSQGNTHLDSVQQIGTCVTAGPDKGVCVQVRRWEDLPENAQRYVQRVQQITGVPIRWIGVGPGRDAIVLQPST